MAREDETKPGPANHQGSDLDAPTPPGGPLRQDAPDTPVTPGGPSTPTQPGEPEPVDPVRPQPGGDPDPHVEPSSTPERPTTVPSPDTPEGEPGPDAVEKNAETSEVEPSDASGAE